MDFNDSDKWTNPHNDTSEIIRELVNEYKINMDYSGSSQEEENYSVSSTSPQFLSISLNALYPHHLALAQEKISYL